MNTEKFEIVAKTFQGLEDVLAEELKNLGAEDIEIGRRMVSFHGDKTLLYKTNLACRTALRILKPIYKFEASNPDEVYEKMKAFEWDTLLSPETTFSIDSVTYSDCFKHSKFVTYRAKDAIADYFMGLQSLKANAPDLGANPELLDSYIAWRRDVKLNSDATINHALTPILKACAYASEMGMMEPAVNARIQDMRIVSKVSLSEEEIEFDGKSLSKEQMLSLLEYYKTCLEPRRKEFLEMFLFAFHACGLRVVDVMTLQWKHIDFSRKELRKIMIKTNKRHVIPLTEPALHILQRWQEKRVGCRYVFNLVKDDLDLDDAEALYKARNNATKCINQSLAVVGEQIGLPFTLSMHVARHSFAVFALNNGLSMSVVSRLLGHGSTDVTEKVYAKFLPETLSAEVARLKEDFASLEIV